MQPILLQGPGCTSAMAIKKRLYGCTQGLTCNKQLVFSFDTAVRSLPNKFGKTVWLKIARNQHMLTGYCSGDGKKWLSMGAPISTVNLDKVHPNYNSWVGTSIGLFAEGRAADFDFFICKDGFSTMPAAGYSNYYGIEKTGDSAMPAVTSTTGYGGWMMLSGVDLGNKTTSASQVEVSVAALTAGELEIWLDDLKNGELIATIPVTATGSNSKWKTFRRTIKECIRTTRCLYKISFRQQPPVIYTIAAVYSPALNGWFLIVRQISVPAKTFSVRQMPTMKKHFLIIALFATAHCFAQSPGLKLWYNTPSGKTWENALPIGNGRLGAMVYGNVEQKPSS